MYPKLHCLLHIIKPYMPTCIPVYPSQDLELLCPELLVPIQVISKYKVRA